MRHANIFLILFFIFACSLFVGCKTNNNNEYLEGNSLIIGLYFPYDGSLYGLQLLNYISGIKYSTTNDIHILRNTCSTNNYFKLVEINEKTQTEIK